MKEASGSSEAFWQNGQSSSPVYNLYGNDNFGQVKRNSKTLTRFYYLKDHIGDIKVIVNATGGVDSYNDFYPFGMQMEGRNQVSTADARFKFIGKERDTQTGYDYFWARYMFF